MPDELKVGDVFESDAGNRWTVWATYTGDGGRVEKCRVQRVPPGGVLPKWDDGFYVFHAEQFSTMKRVAA